MNSSWLGKFTAKEKDSSPYLGGLKKNWHTLVCLIGIFIVALFTRSYFAYDLATEFGTPYLLGGGADSHYNARIINYITENNQHLFQDPLRAYPLDAVNTRPPLYQWSVVLGGYIMSPFFGDLETAVNFSFIFSSAFWGELTTIPVYLIGKRTFGKKAGIAGAFLLAISAGHLERGVITNTNHDAFSLFFVVTAFYFFMRAIEEIPDDKKWVSDWMDLEKIKKGLSEFFGNNKRALLYAAMTGMALGTVALTWKGYAYAIVIILVYFLIKLVIDKFRKKDSLGITISVFVAIIIVFIISVPWYAQYTPGILTDWFRWPLDTWFQVPFIIFLGTFGVGVYFTVTRDIPWVLTFGILALAGVVFFALGPDVLQTAAGQYFIDNKLYATIAEAQAPEFSRLVMAGGVVTFFLSWIGIALAVWHIIGKWTKSFVFILIWAAFSIYMTTSAARFIFTAAPAYALMAGWILALVFDKTDFEYIGKRFRTHRGSKIRGIKEGVKIKHVLVSLLVVFLLLTPNALCVFDASIPFEEKQRYEEQLHDVLPGAFRPSDHEPAEGHQYLGAFGYSLDKPTDYWQASWEEMRGKYEEQGVPPEERPAFASWWDYGFEAMAQGEMPTIADNFQHAYRWAGNLLMSQDESEVMALYIGRQLQLPYREEGEFEGRVREILVDHIGEEKTEKLENIYDDPGSYRREVLTNPDIYHPRADDIDNVNIRWAMVMGTLSSEDLSTLSSLYREMRFNSGYERLENGIGYIAVDSRLFPTSARDTGIFHAPAFLAGYRVEGVHGMRTPGDFYIMELIDAEGRRYESFDDVPPGVEIIDQDISFQPMFYNSTLYRTFAGYAGQHVGEEEGIPGIDHQDLQPMPGWDFTHFKMDYRTAYFNPYPRDEVQNHTDAWRAISLEKAQEYQEDENVTVDMSPQSYMRQGVVFLKHYDGAIMEGEVVTDSGEPISDARVTVIDEYSIPHHTTRTDEDGRYRAMLPEGELTVTVSTGGEEGLDSQQMILRQEEISLGQKQVEVSLEQAMRKEVDTTGDGRWDYLIDGDFEVESGEVSGRVFLDRHGDGVFDEENDTLVQKDGQVIIESLQSDRNYTVDIEEGIYEKTQLAPGKYSATSTIPGSDSIEFTVNPGEKIGEGIGNPGNPSNPENSENPDPLDIEDDMIDPGDDMIDPGMPDEEEVVSADIPITVGEVGGNITYGEGARTADESIELALRNSDQTIDIDLGDSLYYIFEYLLPGEYTLEVKSEGYDLYQGPLHIEIENGAELHEDIHIVETHRVEGIVTRDGEPIPNQKLTVLGRVYDRVITTDEDGRFDVKMPEEVYQIYGTERKGERTYVLMESLMVDSDRIDDERYEGEFKRGHKLSGVFEYDGQGVPNAEVFVIMDTGEEHYLTTNAEGKFSAYVPRGYHTVYGWTELGGEGIEYNLYFWDEVNIGRDRDIIVEGENGSIVDGHVNRGMIEDGDIEPGEGIYARIEASFDDVTLARTTDIDGNYRFVLPEKEVRFRIEKEGYYSKVVNMHPPEDIQTDISLEAKNISVEGEVDFDHEKTDELSISFEPIGNGAVDRENITVRDSYQVDLQPGEYEININEILDDGDAKYQLSENLFIEPGDEPVVKDLDPAYRVKVNGSILGEEGEPAQADIHFAGVENRDIYGANGTYNIYLQPGNYSVRAVNRDEQISMQKNLSITNSTTSNITLRESILVRAYLSYEGDRKSDIPVILENKQSGYEIKTVSEEDGELNISISEGEYRLKVDFPTEEEINGLERDVIYSLDEVTHTDDLGARKAVELERKVLNSTFSGYVKLNDRPVEYVEVNIFSEGEPLDIDEIVTDETGYFEVEELLNGEYTIYITHQTSKEIHAVFDFFVMGDENKHVDISLEEAVILRGKVSLNGDGVETEEVTIRKERALMTFSTDEEGYYRTIVPKGRYDINTESDKEIEEYGLTTYGYEESIELKYDEYHDIELSMIKEYHIEIDELETKKASQGESISYRARIKNAGNTRDEYEITSDTDWHIEFEPSSISLKPGERKSVDITITVDENASVDHEPIMFRVDSMRSAESEEKEIPIEVEAFYGLELSSEIVSSRYSYGKITSTVNITNTGNIIDTYNLVVTNRASLEDQGWSVSIDDQIEIDDQNVEQVEIRLEAIRSNPRENIEINLRARSATERTMMETVSVRTSVPLITADAESIDLEGDEVHIEEESFTMSTWHWVLIVLTIATISIYVMKKKRWI